MSHDSSVRQGRVQAHQSGNAGSGKLSQQFLRGLETDEIVQEAGEKDDERSRKQVPEQIEMLDVKLSGSGCKSQNQSQ